MEINDLDFKNAVERYIEINPDIIITEEMINKSYEIFETVKKEKLNINRKGLEKESFVTAILGQVIIGQDKDTLTALYSDNKHMNYFDVFLDKGEARKIQKALTNKGLSTEVLRGIKKSLPEEGKKIAPNILYVQELGENENGSLVIVNVEIVEVKDNGENEVIYNWKRKQDFEVPDIKLPDILKAGFKQTIILSDGTKIRKEILKNNRTIYRDAKGRFTKKI